MPDQAKKTVLGGSSPPDWLVDRIKDHVKEVIGGVWGDDPDAHDKGVVVPVLRVADFRGLDVEGTPPTSRRISAAQLESRRLSKQSVLIEKSGGGAATPVGRVVSCRNLSVEDAICSNFIAKVECSPTLDPMFLVYVSRALYTTRVNEACIQQTTGIQNLRLRDFLSLKVAFPPLPEQRAITEYLDERCKSLGGVYGSPQAVAVPEQAGSSGLLSAQMHLVEEYRDSIVYEYVTGEKRLAVADPTKAKAHG